MEQLILTCITDWEEGEEEEEEEDDYEEDEEGDGRDRRRGRKERRKQVKKSIYEVSCEQEPNYLLHLMYRTFFKPSWTLFS